jgi:hypothetical protein
MQILYQRNGVRLHLQQQLQPPHGSQQHQARNHINHHKQQQQQHQLRNQHVVIQDCLLPAANPLRGRDVHQRQQALRDDGRPLKGSVAICSRPEPILIVFSTKNKSKVE